MYFVTRVYTLYSAQKPPKHTARFQQDSQHRASKTCLSYKLNGRFDFYQHRSSRVSHYELVTVRLWTFQYFLHIITPRSGTRFPTPPKMTITDHSNFQKTNGAKINILRYIRLSLSRLLVILQMMLWSWHHIPVLLYNLANSDGKRSEQLWKDDPHKTKHSSLHQNLSQPLLWLAKCFPQECILVQTGGHKYATRIVI